MPSTNLNLFGETEASTTPPGFEYRSELIDPAEESFAGLSVEDFKQVLVSEYTPGTPIGWHKDREHYDKIVGVSLLSAALFRFRREHGDQWTRLSRVLEPRSAYLLAGPARDLWQHSIPAVQALRYSVTFRTMRAQHG